MKSKLKAFTILELMIVMAVISIVALLGAFVYQQSNNFLLNIEHQSITKYDQLQGLHVLQSDIESSKEINKSTSSLVMKKTGEVINYELKPGFTVRTTSNSPGSDTLTFSVQNTGYQKNTKLVNAIEVQFPQSKYPFILKKQYSATQLINYADRTQSKY
ncbi:type II secretion system protein [Salibacter halophilus]|uniref:Type II secretion system protein n=1 Tax=Salibacter halophilus TaxID=1803916 RepID=A0A6N6M426_9FLAO|nr:type II secretion system protein [Salibacter halophilus]KAB1061969.1 type II secretion system protein [Salibacter halophilus]